MSLNEKNCKGFDDEKFVKDGTKKVRFYFKNFLKEKKRKEKEKQREKEREREREIKG